jgi:hypothetical protein
MDIPTAILGGLRTFAGTRSGDKVAPKNEPARAAGEYASRPVRFRWGDER